MQQDIFKTIWKKILGFEYTLIPQKKGVKNVMKQEDVNQLLHKIPGAAEKEDLPICLICGQEFLGTIKDKICADCAKGEYK